MATLVPTIADVNKIYTYCIRKVTSSNETTTYSTDELPLTTQTSVSTASDNSITTKQSSDSQTLETTNRTSTDETQTALNFIRDREKRSFVAGSTELTAASTVQTTQSKSIQTTNTATDPTASTGIIITTEVFNDYNNVSSVSNITSATTASIIYCVDEIVTASMNASDTTTDLFDLVSGTTDKYSNGSTTSNNGISVTPTTNFASYLGEVSTTESVTSI